VGTAPWLKDKELRRVVLPLLDGWDYAGNALGKKRQEWFGVRDGKWATGPAYKAELAAQYEPRAPRAAGPAPSAGAGAGLLASLKGLFHWPGANPLQGQWRMAQSRMFGVTLPAGLAPDITFTADSYDSGGLSVKAKFEVDGGKVRVTPEGEAAGIVFVMEGSDAMHIEQTGMRYERVR
jgi:hypothetical protein